MINAGWNKTVLPKLKYEIAGVKYQLPEVPSYDTLVHNCTCTNKKRPLLEAHDLKGADKLRFCFTESCPVNILYALIGRQCGARVNPDKEVMKRFGIFVDWINSAIIKEMQKDKFVIDFS